MNRYLSFALLVLLTTCFTNSAVSEFSVDDYPQQSVATEQKCFLWEAKSQSNTVYLLGSIHLATPEFYPLNKKFEEAFNKTNILVVEVNTNSVDQNEIREIMMQTGLYPQGGTLDAHISEHTYELAKERLQKLGLSPDQFRRYKPWFAALELSVLELRGLGFDPNYGIDKYFLDRAKGKKMILELETFDFQIKLFDSFSDYYQELFLFYTIVDLDIIEKEIQILIRAWACGDVEELESIVSRPILKYPQIEPIYEKLIYERNRSMLVKIEQYLSMTEDYFIIIGAAHLVGEKGIIKLLKQKGYLLKQL